MPDKIIAFLDEHGVHIPDEQSPEAMVIYQRAKDGYCMLCESKCGETVVIVANDLGVVMLFCSQVCMQDFLNMHWLMEQYDDMVESARFRNQAGNN
jgi:hypothetical protein